MIAELDCDSPGSTRRSVYSRSSGWKTCAVTSTPPRLYRWQRVSASRAKGSRVAHSSGKGEDSWHDGLASDRNLDIGLG